MGHHLMSFPVAVFSFCSIEFLTVGTRI